MFIRMREVHQAYAEGGGARPNQAPWWLRALSRQRFVLAAFWLALTAAAAAWIRSLPAIYRSEAVVLTEAHRIPEKLIPASVEANPQERLEAVRQKLLSSSQLRALVWELSLFAKERQAGASQESLVGRLRKDLSILPEGPASRSGAGSFRVTYRGTDPQAAARVANRVAALFVEEANRARSSSSVAAAQFLSAQVASARKALEEREAALREFRLRYHGELPEQEEVLRAAAGRLRAELKNLQQASLKLAHERTALEQAVAAAQASHGNRQENPEPPAAGVNGPAHRGASRAEELRARVSTLLAVYRADHPDVQRLMAELARMEERGSRGMATTGAGEPARPDASASVGGLSAARRAGTQPLREGQEASRSRLASASSRLEALGVQQAQVSAELGALEQRLQRIPVRREQLQALMRDYALSNEHYRTLASRKQSADLAADMGRNYPAERIRMLEQAQAPLAPVGPSRRLMYTVSALGALVVGCLIAVAREADLGALRMSLTRRQPARNSDRRRLSPQPEWTLTSDRARQAGGRMARSG